MTDLFEADKQLHHGASELEPRGTKKISRMMGREAAVDKLRTAHAVLIKIRMSNTSAQPYLRPGDPPNCGRPQL